MGANLHPDDETILRCAESVAVALHEARPDVVGYQRTAAVVRGVLLMLGAGAFACGGQIMIPTDAHPSTGMLH